MQNQTIKGFKAMEPDMTCRGFQFQLGKTFKHHGLVAPCVSGFHFCQKIQDIYRYYGTNCRIFEVEASGAIIEEGDKTVTDALTIGREIDYNAYIDHDSIWVRSVVACRGVGLDVLINDVDWTVRQAVARQGYGLDVLINDKDWEVRYEIAKQGYGLDILINDRNCHVRAEVAKQGYGLDVLIKDESWQVRIWVANQGYGLDQLINDKHLGIRSLVMRQIEELNNG